MVSKWLLEIFLSVSKFKLYITGQSKLHEAFSDRSSGIGQSSSQIMRLGIQIIHEF